MTPPPDEQDQDEHAEPGRAVAHALGDGRRVAAALLGRLVPTDLRGRPPLDLPLLGGAARSFGAWWPRRTRLVSPGGSLRHGRYDRAGPWDARVLVIDNYDSFVYNLVQELGELGAEPVVLPQRRHRRGRHRAERPDAVLISPGPGAARGRRGVSLRPSGSWPGRSRCSASAWATSASARSSAASVVAAAPHLMHGKTSEIHHDGTGDLRRPAQPLRGHPLPLAGGAPDSVPDELEVTATSTDGVIMGLRHRSSRSRGCSSTPSRC
jgi:para-aminobenzoate synthetase component 2